MLALARGEPYTARSDFESALTHCPDHPDATIGLSNILLDIFSEKLLPPRAIPPWDDTEPNQEKSRYGQIGQPGLHHPLTTLPASPLGLGPSNDAAILPNEEIPASRNSPDQLPAPYKATHLPLVDRLAARERAFTLLSGLTRLGSGWSNSDAWFALARAHEECGQPEKAKEVLWWCVELEESMGVREWRCLGNGGYII